MKMFHGVWAGRNEWELGAKIWKCNRTKAGYLRWHLVVEGCRPASYSLNVLERYGNLLPAVYPAQKHSASLMRHTKKPHARVGNCQASDKRKSLMRKHGAFLYAASVRLNASEQDKRLEADFHIAPGRSENSWQVGSPRLPNA
ncbi:hypothetical protein, partial [Cronobacter sakazakii]|uniref:hypothetical protein n=1 Tax=Cronobacter sakazakii TaxID=28141 RepID=UPI00195B8961